MCGRYRLRRNWEQDLQDYLRLVIEKVDVDELQANSEHAGYPARMLGACGGAGMH